MEESKELPVDLVCVNSIVLESTGSGTQLPGFKSQPCRLLAVQSLGKLLNRSVSLLCHVYNGANNAYTSQGCWED